MNPPELFEYPALPPGTTIRVLALEPGTPLQRLKGELIEVDLNAQNISFAALSYVWGSPVIYDRAFELPTGFVLLTASLETALKRLRLPDKILYIWADGICINQADITERASQVKLMRDVYKKAREVIVWLGKYPADRAKTVFDFIGAYASDKTNVSTQSRNHAVSPSAVVERLAQRGGLGQAGNTQERMLAVGMAMASMSQFAQLDYFKRIWVIQEAFLNPNTKLVLGSEQISMDDFSYGISCHIAESQFEDMYEGAFGWVSKIHAYKDEQDGFDIFGMLQWVRSRRCMDDRDRLYGILALPYNQNPWNTFVKDFEPSYAISVDDLYLQIAQEIATRGGTVQLLSSVHHGASLDDFFGMEGPSWIPKWNEFHAMDIENEHLASQAHCVGSVDLDKKTLSVECMFIDCVDMYSSSDLVSAKKKINASSVLRFWKSAFRLVEKDINDLDKAWLNVRFCDALYGRTYKREDGSLCQLHGSRDLQRALELKIHGMSGNVEKEEVEAGKELLNIVSESINRVKESNPELESEDESSAYHDYRPGELLRNRILFFTDEHQFGLGPEGATPGDVIGVLKGSGVPFIFSKEVDSYRLMGAAYIPESLRREAVNRAEIAGRKVEKIEIL